MLRYVGAVVVVDSAPDRLALRPVQLADPARDEVVVRVNAISLNRGETRRALTMAQSGWRPGWDFAGIVQEACERSFELFALDHAAVAHHRVVVIRAHR